MRIHKIATYHGVIMGTLWYFSWNTSGSEAIVILYGSESERYDSYAFNLAALGRS